MVVGGCANACKHCHPRVLRRQEGRGLCGGHWGACSGGPLLRLRLLQLLLLRRRLLLL
jgi:hypothetical protein